MQIDALQNTIVEGRFLCISIKKNCRLEVANLHFGGCQFTFWRAPIYILEAEVVWGCSIEKGGSPKRAVPPGTKLASMRAWEKADFGPPARNRKKNRWKIDFGLSRKIGKKSLKNRKNGPKTDFWAIFPIFLRFFPYFPGEAKIDFLAIFSDFGPEARNRHSPRHAYSQNETNTWINSPGILSCIRAGANTGATCIRTETNALKNLAPMFDTEYDRAKVPPYNGNDPRPPLVV